jgi:hypothetical protein
VDFGGLGDHHAGMDATSAAAPYAADPQVTDEPGFVHVVPASQAQAEPHVDAAGEGALRRDRLLASLTLTAGRGWRSPRRLRCGRAPSSSCR